MTQGWPQENRWWDDNKPGDKWDEFVLSAVPAFIPVCPLCGALIGDQAKHKQDHLNQARHGHPHDHPHNHPLEGEGP